MSLYRRNVGLRRGHPSLLVSRNSLVSSELRSSLPHSSDMFNFRTVYGHVGGRVRSRGCVQCSIMDASLELFSRVLVECHRYYEQDNMWHACVGTARGQQYLQLPKNLFTSHRNRPSTVYRACGQGKDIFTCKQSGSS